MTLYRDSKDPDLTDDAKADLGLHCPQRDLSSRVKDTTHEFLAIQWASSKDSDQTMQVCRMT